MLRPRVMGWKQLLRTYVHETVDEATGEVFRLGEFHLGLLPPRVVVKDLSLQRRADGLMLAHVHRVVAKAGWVNGRPGLASVRLESPVVTLPFDEEGRLDAFRNLPPPKGGEPLSSLPFNKLLIIDGRVELQHPSFSGRLSRLDLRSDELLAAELTLSRAPWREKIILSGEGISVGGSGAKVESLSVDASQLGSVQLSGALDLGEGWDILATLDLDLAPLTPLFKPPGAIQGLAKGEISAHSVTNQASTTTFDLQLSDIHLDSLAKTGRVLHREFGDIHLDGALQGQFLNIDHLDMLWGDGEITASAEIDLAGKTLQASTIHGDALSLRRIFMELDAFPTPWVDFIGEADVSLTGDLSPLKLNGPFTLLTEDFVVNSGPIYQSGTAPILSIPSGDLSGELLIDGTSVVLDAKTVRTPKTEGKIYAYLGLSPTGPLDVSFHFPEGDLETFAPLGGAQLRGRGDLKGRVYGPYSRLQARATADITDFEALGLPWADQFIADLHWHDLTILDLVDVKATIGSTIYGGNLGLQFDSTLGFTADVAFGEARVEDLLGIFLDLPGVSGDVSGYLRLDGPYNRLNGEGSLRFGETTLFGESFEEGKAFGTLTDGRFTLDTFKLQRLSGREQLRVTGGVDYGWALDLDIQAQGFRLEDLNRLEPSALNLQGDIVADLLVAGTLFEPAPNGVIALTGVRLNGLDIEDSRVNLSTTDGLLSWDAQIAQRLSGAGTLDLWQTQQWTLDAHAEAFPLHVFYPKGADGSPLTALTTGDLSAGGSLNQNDGAAPYFEATVDDISLDWSTHHLSNPSPWTLVRQESGQWTSSIISLQGGRTDLSFDFAFASSPHFDGGGTLDLDLARALIPGLLTADGVATLNVDTVGQGTEAQPEITVTTTGAVLEHSSVPAPFEEVDISAFAGESGVLIDSIEGILGGGTVEGSGLIQSSGWKPQRVDLDVDLHDIRIQWVDSLPSAFGQAKLRFNGPVDKLVLSGDVDIEAMEFTDRIEWEGSVVDFRGNVLQDGTRLGATSLFSFDIGLHAPDTLRFDNNVAEGDGSGELRLVGDTSRPGLVGRIALDEGALAFLQDRTFQVDRGVIIFRDPWSWDPQLDVDLSTTLQSQGTTYDINYQIRGLYSNWQTSATSSPSLDVGDINALLWLGATPDDLSQSGDGQALAGAVAGNLAELFLSDLLASTGAAELRGEVSTLDRIEFATGTTLRGEWSTDPRIRLSKRFRSLGDIELTGEFNLIRSDDQYVQIQRRFGDTWRFAVWYATFQRLRTLPIGGAYGVTLSVRWEAP